MERGDSPKKVISFPPHHRRKIIGSDECGLVRFFPPRPSNHPVLWHDFPEHVLRQLRELHGREWWRW
jgi:hypothetical protein